MYHRHVIIYCHCSKTYFHQYSINYSTNIFQLFQNIFIIMLFGFIFYHRYYFKTCVICNSYPKSKMYLVFNICMFMFRNISTIVLIVTFLAMLGYDVTNTSTCTWVKAHYGELLCVVILYCFLGGHF
jgi:hypothetical protein